MNRTLQASLLLSSVSIVFFTNCASVTANIADTKNTKSPTLGGQNLYMEPLREDAETELHTQDVGSNTTAVYLDKPFFAKEQTRKLIYKKTLKHLQNDLGAKLVNPQDGPSLILVRTTITGQKVTNTNLWIQNLACVFGAAFLCPPLWIYNAVAPVHIEIQVQAVLQIFEIPGDAINKRLISKPGSVYPYMITQGLPALAQKEIETTVVVERGFIDAYVGQAKDAEVLGEAYSQYLAGEIATTIQVASEANQQMGLGVPGDTSTGSASGSESDDADTSDSQSW